MEKLTDWILLIQAYLNETTGLEQTADTVMDYIGAKATTLKQGIMKENMYDQKFGYVGFSLTYNYCN